MKIDTFVGMGIYNSGLWFCSIITCNNVIITSNNVIDDLFISITERMQTVRRPGALIRSGQVYVR